MNPTPTLENIQIAGYNAMLHGHALRTPDAPNGFTFNPYKPDSAERINFSVGCVIALFPYPDE